MGEPAASRAWRSEASLTERDRAVLEFERVPWQHAGSKEQAIRDQFGLSATRYYQLLGTLIDTAAALSYDPLLVARLRRMREARVSARAARTFSRP